MCVAKDHFTKTGPAVDRVSVSQYAKRYDDQGRRLMDLVGMYDAADNYECNLDLLCLGMQASAPIAGQCRKPCADHINSQPL